MLSSLLDIGVQRFIDENIGADTSKLALQKNPFPNCNWVEIINQIAAKTKAQDKLPTWFQKPKILYPSKVSIEQTSSEKTAEYKSHLISGESIIDLTGGFGVDDYYFAKRFKKVLHCEMNADLSEIAQHNFEQLETLNIECLTGDSFEILKNGNTYFDWIYIDPSRRNDSKGKVFMLKDCLPHVPELLSFYLKYSKNILIKTAPVLDISAGLSELKNVRRIHIIAVENEVKELLWEIQHQFSGTIELHCANLFKDSVEIFNFKWGENAVSNFSLPKKYLYEPNSAIMKSGGFDAVGLRFGLEKLHPHSHLYTSDEVINFPGRIFEIESQFQYHKSAMKQFLESGKANITTRNFPDAVASIRKKWNIKDGGNRYCFFTTDLNDHKIVLICSKIK